VRKKPLDYENSDFRNQFKAYEKKSILNMVLGRNIKADHPYHCEIIFADKLSCSPYFPSKEEKPEPILNNLKEVVSKADIAIIQVYIQKRKEKTSLISFLKAVLDNIIAIFHDPYVSHPLVDIQTDAALDSHYNFAFDFSIQVIIACRNSEQLLDVTQDIQAVIDKNRLTYRNSSNDSRYVKRGAIDYFNGRKPFRKIHIPPSMLRRLLKSDIRGIDIDYEPPNITSLMDKDSISSKSAEIVSKYS
ncbi:MAG: hypothetical protein ACFFD4_40130, partial [Candidatus Odinarchaeota archaeon]